MRSFLDGVFDVSDGTNIETITMTNGSLVIYNPTAVCTAPLNIINHNQEILKILHKQLKEKQFDNKVKKLLNE